MDVIAVTVPLGTLSGKLVSVIPAETAPGVMVGKGAYASITHPPAVEVGQAGGDVEKVAA